MRKNNILFRIDQSFKLQMVVCIILSFIVITGFFIANKILDVRKAEEYTIVNDIKFINSIESIIYKDNDIILRGYAFLLDRNANDSSISIILHNTETEEDIWLNTVQSARHDVNNYYDCEYDYKNSGFIASTDEEKLDKDALYEIIINIDYKDNTNENSIVKRKTVSSGRYILNDKLYDYNPNKFDLPNMKSESDFLWELFTNGQLCLYQKDYNMYVYQYQGKLYWIVSKDYQFSDNETIIYHLYTTQVSKLPENRIQYKFDNMDFKFEQYECTDMSTDTYRVAVRNIPDDYPIAYVTTGVYDRENKKSVWTKNFQLRRVVSIE